MTAILTAEEVAAIKARADGVDSQWEAMRMVRVDVPALCATVEALRAERDRLDAHVEALLHDDYSKVEAERDHWKRLALAYAALAADAKEPPC